MLILLIALCIIAIGLGTIVGLYNNNDRFSEAGGPAAVISLFLMISVILFLSAVMVNGAVNPTHDEVTTTPASYQNKTYKVSKNKDVFVTTDNKTVQYPYKIDKIIYNNDITAPQVEVTTIKHYGDINSFSWGFGEHKISYETRITKLTLPEKALTEDLSIANTIIAGPTSSDNNGF